MATEKADGFEDDEANIVSTYGPIEVDWPRTIGFYGGLGVVVAMEMLAPPLALFIAAYPLLKMLNRPRAPLAVQLVAQVLEGAAQPINGAAEGTIRIKSAAIPRPAALAKTEQASTATKARATSRPPTRRAPRAQSKAAAAL